MSEARLAPGIEVSALLALATAQGGFGAVLHKGDPDRGSLVVVLPGRGGEAAILLERAMSISGSYDWNRREMADSAGVDQYLARGRRNDPDLWAVELDVPSPERLIAEMTARG